MSLRTPTWLNNRRSKNSCISSVPWLRSHDGALSLRMFLLILWFGKRGWLWWWSCTSIIKCRDWITYQSSWGSCLPTRFPLPPFLHFCRCHRLRTWWRVTYAHNMIWFYMAYIKDSKLRILGFCIDFVHYTKCCLKLGVLTTANLNWLFVYFFFLPDDFTKMRVPRKYISIL